MQYEHSNYYLAHHGVKGQKWGVRRYQNADGTLKDPQIEFVEKKGRKLSTKEAKMIAKNAWGDTSKETIRAVIKRFARTTTNKPKENTPYIKGTKYTKEQYKKAVDVLLNDLEDYDRAAYEVFGNNKLTKTGELALEQISKRLSKEYKWDPEEGGYKKI